MKRFLRYNSRHHLWFPRGYQGRHWPQLNPISSIYDRTWRPSLHEPLWLFRLRQRLFCFAGRHRCPDRGAGPGTPDTWRIRPDGNRTCTYCGSMSEENLFDIIEHYLAGDAGYRFETTTKSYKVYANRPGVQNAGLGAIKFYMGHADHSHPDIEKRKALFSQAVKKAHADLHALLAPKAAPAA